MAIPVNINDLINRTVVESTRIEFKSDWNPEPILHTICAFANDIDNMGGGYIVIGVEEEDGAPVIPVKGIEKNRIDSIEKKLRECCHYIEPFYQPVAEPFLFEGKHVLVIWVSGGYSRPYKASVSLSDRRSDKRYYIRKASSTVVASPEEEKQLYYVSSDIPFDDRANLAADITDLDLGLIREHLKKVGSDLYAYSLGRDLNSLAEDMQLVSGPSEFRKPKNVGLLMFSEHPEKYFRYARIDVVDVPDPTGRNMTEKIFTGPIQRQLSEALMYIKNYILKEAVIKSGDKAEAERIMNYPYAAVEEILSNAVYHRSYRINEPITVRITPAAIEITSFPGFDRSITDEKIKSLDIRSMVYRNRRIGDFLKELKLTEGRNTGFPTAFNALRENGSDMPSFEMDADRGYLTVIIPVHQYFLKKTDANNSEYDRKILSAVGSRELNLTEIAKEMGYKGITKKLSNAVSNLYKTNALERTFSAERGVVYEVKKGKNQD
ncbi:MAG: putative DNA binding domain-containing protein [Clostridia bacterium]|nr:putative DNA binding domain-containing protein [Clostridia bacterium]